MKAYDRREERTGIQEASDFDPIFDVQSDFVMVYGFHNLKERIRKWKKRGYVVHLMTGVSWGAYQDYLYGRYDGIDHHDEGQRRRDGTEMNHGEDIPYMVPSNAFAHYLADGLKKAVDCGVEAIHLEEPEFWVSTGYSDAFKREWAIYYKEPWQDPQSSCDAQYRASKLKQYLYTRTLDRLCSELKEYAMVKYGRLLRFYIPTHSLINYTQWKIVSPESALIDLPTVDGAIAQIWTGTARTQNVYRGVEKERTFETAFLEYGIMQELVRGTGRKMWFLADPIEDDPNHTWADYRENYYRTVAASLFHPEISDYEVSPWPGRVMCSRHHPNDEALAADRAEYEAWRQAGKNPNDFRPSEERKTIIPPAYKTNLLTVMHALRDMKDQADCEWLTKTADVGILMADSAMFQRICPEAGGDDGGAFSSFFGLALPLLKAGISARPIQLDNIRRFPGYLDAYRAAVLSYAFMKPSAPDIHQAIAGWVRNGGLLIYAGNGSDPFRRVREWWNADGTNDAAPEEHLFEALGLGRHPGAGIYDVGSGKVCCFADAPASFAADPAKSDRYRDTVVSLLCGSGIAVEPEPKLMMRRGAYVVTAVMDECGAEETALRGTFIDVFDERLAVVTDPILKEGSVNLWYDVSKIDKRASSELLLLSGRAEKIVQGQRSLTFVSRGPSEMTAACRVWTKRPPKSVRVTADGAAAECAFEYDAASETTCFAFPSDGNPVKVTVAF